MIADDLDQHGEPMGREATAGDQLLSPDDVRVIDAYLCERCFGSMQEAERRPARIRSLREMLAGLALLHDQGIIDDADYESRSRDIATELHDAGGSLDEPEPQQGGADAGAPRRWRRHRWVITRTGIDGHPFRIERQRR